MGSCGAISLASTAYSSNSWNAGGSDCLAKSVVNICSLNVHRASTCIRFCVNVPVLSTQSTVVSPSVSIACNRRVSTCCLPNLRAAKAKKIIMITARMMPMMANRFVSELICSRSGEACGSISSSDCPIVPICVFRPVRVTLTTPWPLTTKVPANTDCSTVFDTGSDSPVSMDSSSDNSCACNSVPSAGTRSPSARITLSSRTTS